MPRALPAILVALLAVVSLLAGAQFSGRYTLQTYDTGYAYRLDRWTGHVLMFRRDLPDDTLRLYGITRAGLFDDVLKDNRR